MKKGLQKFTQQLISLVLLLKYQLVQGFKALHGGFAVLNGMNAIAKGLKSFADGDFVTGNESHTKHLQPLFINTSTPTIINTKNLFTRGTVMLRC